MSKTLKEVVETLKQNNFLNLSGNTYSSNGAKFIDLLINGFAERFNTTIEQKIHLYELRAQYLYGASVDEFKKYSQDKGRDELVTEHVLEKNTSIADVIKNGPSNTIIDTHIKFADEVGRELKEDLEEKLKNQISIDQLCIITATTNAQATKLRSGIWLMNNAIEQNKKRYGEKQTAERKDQNSQKIKGDPHYIDRANNIEQLKQEKLEALQGFFVDKANQALFDEAVRPIKKSYDDGGDDIKQYLFKVGQEDSRSSFELCQEEFKKITKLDDINSMEKNFKKLVDNIEEKIEDAIDPSSSNTNLSESARKFYDASQKLWRVELKFLKDVKQAAQDSSDTLSISALEQNDMSLANQAKITQANAAQATKVVAPRALPLQAASSSPENKCAR